MKHEAPLAVLISLVALPWLWTAPLSAQAQTRQEPSGNTGPSVVPAYAGDCVVVRSGNAQVGSVIGLELNLALTQERRLTSGDSQTIEFQTEEPLRAGHQLRLRLNGQAVADSTVQMRVDNDIRGDAADAIQTLYGFSWDLGALFRN